MVIEQNENGSLVPDCPPQIYRGERENAYLVMKNNLNKSLREKEVEKKRKYCTISNDSSPRDFFDFSDKSPKTTKIKIKLLPV